MLDIKFSISSGNPVKPDKNLLLTLNPNILCFPTKSSKFGSKIILDISSFINFVFACVDNKSSVSISFCSTIFRTFSGSTKLPLTAPLCLKTVSSLISAKEASRLGSKGIYPLGALG